MPVSALKALGELRCAVGIPESANDRGEAVGNAALLALHEHGSPLRGLPARPLLEPALEEARGELSVAMGESLKAALDGGAPRAALDAVGEAALGALLSYFDRAPWPPNSPATVRRKGSSQTLVETGALRAALSREVRARSL